MTATEEEISGRHFILMTTLDQIGENDANTEYIKLAELEKNYQAFSKDCFHK